MVKKMFGLFAAALIIFGIMQTVIVTVSADKNRTKTTIRSDFSDANDLVNTLQVGWNLGNALDSINGAKGNSVKTTETCWGNPVTTKRMIEMVSDAGFKTVRVPVTYFGNSDWDANIDEAWLDRVQEVVDYVLDCDMYCIINIHHDTGKGAWISPDTDKYERSSYRIRRLWEQIAERFKDYDNRLVFEGMNEILNRKEQWTEASDENYMNVNNLNQIFVDTVRASGGNNNKRFLMVPLYAAIASRQNIDGFVLPRDTIPNHLIISYHSYDTGERSIDATFALIKNSFLDKGVPAVLGEFGMRNSTKEDNTQRRIAYINKVVSEARALKIACIWWDDGGYFSSPSNVTNYCLLDRYSYRWNFPKVVDQLVKTSAAASGGNHVTEDDSEVITTTTTTATTASTTSTTTITTTTSTTTTTTTTTVPSTNANTTVNNAVLTPYAHATLTDGAVAALQFPNMASEIETDITMGVGCEYEFTCALDNDARYGNLMLTHDGTRMGYRVRQELDDIYTAYGYNNFKALDIVPGQMYTISQKGDNTYVDGNLIMRNVTQNFNEGTLTIGNCRMFFFGMTIKQNGQVTHKLEPAKDDANTPCILDRITGKRYYSAHHIMYGFLVPGTTDFQNLYAVKALSIPRMDMEIETDITLGVGCEYNFVFSLDNDSRYGNLMLTHDGKRIGYRVRQELSDIYTAYGYNNFKALDIVPGQIYTVSQKGDNTYVDGNLIMHNVTQDFSEGTLSIGDCRMNFYGMTVTEGGTITHNLVPSIDETGKPCIFDEVTGKLYYSNYNIGFIN